MSTRLDYNKLIESRQRLSSIFSDPSIVRQSKHRLRGGEEATFFVDFDIATNDPQICAGIVQNYSAKLLEITLKRNIDFIAFIEKMGRATVGAIRVAGAISIDTGIPSFIIRIGKELPFEKIKLYGKRGLPAKHKLTDLKIALITDHMTSGAEILQAIKIIEDAKGNVSDVLVHTLKPQAAEDTIKILLDKGIVFHSLNYIYDLPDGTYRHTQGGTVESKDELLTFA